MGKLKSGWSFGKEHGFSGSCGETSVKGYMRGGRVGKPVGPIKSKGHGPVKGSAPTGHLPPSPSKRPSTGKQHKFAHGGKVKGGPTDRKPATGGMLPYAKGGGFKKEDKEPHEHQRGFKPEDQEAHESDTGFTHDDVEKPYEHYEAKKGGWIKGAIKHPGIEKRAAKRAGESTHEYMEEHKHSPGKAGQRARLGLRLSAMHKKARGGAVQGYNAGGDQDPEHNHFLSSHKIESHHKGIHHHGHGFSKRHHAPPHESLEHRKYADGGSIRPMGMPRAPMLGMKRVRHGPGQRQMPGLPGMAPVGTSPLGMGAGTAPRVMKRGGRK